VLINRELIVKILSTVLIWLMVLPFVNQTVVFSKFQINRAEIAEKSCVNNAPQSTCHGTCQLVEAIQNQEPEDNKSPFAPNSQKEVTELQWIFENISHHLFVATELNQKRIVYSKNSIADQYQSDLFRPPQA